MVPTLRTTLLLAFSLAACGGGGGGTIDGPGPDDGPPADSPVGPVDDGTPTRQNCTSNFGNALTTSFGRLDGFLVAIVPPQTGACNADRQHVHLQIKMNGDIYDVAVDVTAASGPDDVHTLTMDHAPLGAPWSEGWHTGVSLDYTQAPLDVHSTDLPLKTKAEMTDELMSDLADVNHISVFAIGYGPDGVHLVHRNGGLHDGMIVTQPLSNPAHLRLLSFSDQTF